MLTFILGIMKNDFWLSYKNIFMQLFLTLVFLSVYNIRTDLLRKHLKETPLYKPSTPLKARKNS